MAALEWARHAAYHAADATPLPLAALAAATEQAGEVVFVLHPSLRLVSSAYPVVTIFELHGDDGDPAPTLLEGGGEDALVLRPCFDVELRRLPKGAVPFIQALKDGMSLLGAAEAALVEAPEFDLVSNLAALMGSGAIVDMRKSHGVIMQEGRPQAESALPSS
jgi:hypothetical protein